MLELATKAFYTHDTLVGLALVALFCGSMILWGAYVAYTNFGPRARRRAQGVKRR